MSEEINKTSVNYSPEEGALSALIADIPPPAPPATFFVLLLLFDCGDVAVFCIRVHLDAMSNNDPDDWREQKKKKKKVINKWE